MKKIEEIIKENKDTYLWGDKITIDLIVKSEKSFLDIINSVKCESCESLLITDNKDILNKIDSNVNGIQIDCKTCKQKWFIHKPVNIPKAVTGKSN